MYMTFRATVLAAAAVFGGSIAHASAIDFTDASAYGVSITQTSATTLTGTAAGGWTGATTGGPINLSEAGPGAQSAFVAGDNDGLGIGDDEISVDPTESFTISFNTTVTIAGLYFLDHYAPEEVHVSIDGGTPLAPFISTVSPPTPGYTEFENLSLTGQTFTFTVGEPNQTGAVADYALAGIDIAAIPLPAGLLLLGGALGMLGATRRRKA
ncbi:MAG: hypothetical protein AAGH70_00285 [Pseudomonadota bacterium]